MRGFAPARVGFLVLLLGVAPAFGDGPTYSGSLGVASGDYTLTETTTSLLFVHSLGWTAGRWRFSVGVPIVHQDTPYVTYVGGVPVPTGRRWGATSSSPTAEVRASGSGPGSGRQLRDGRVVVPDPEVVDFTKTGVGDPLLRADLRLGPPSGRWGLYLAAKPPLADETDGFGTGEWDAGVGVTFAAPSGPGRFFAELGWWSYGDPAGYELEDPVVGSVGFVRAIDERWSWLATVTAVSEGFDGADGPVEVGVSLSRSFVGGRFLSLALGAGLTETAPDYRVTVGWSTGL